MRKPKATVQDAGWQQKQRVWRHNAFSGHAAMMRAQARNIGESDSTTQAAKNLAQQIGVLAEQLAVALKTRIDPEAKT